MEGMGLKLTPVVVRCLLGPLSMFGSIAGTLGLIARPNSPNGGYGLPLTAHLPHCPPHPPPNHPPLICATHDIMVL